MILLIILLIVNIIVSFSIFLSLMGTFFYGLRFVRRRKTETSYYSLIYLCFFIWMFFFHSGNLLGFNWIVLFNSPNATILFFDLVAWITLVNYSAIISFLFLALALRLEFIDSQKARNVPWIILVGVGCFTFIMYLFTKLELLEVENFLPLFSYDPAWVVNFSTLFAMITGIWYGFQTIKHYLESYRTKYGYSTYHYLFMAISIIAFIALGSAMAFRFIFPLDSQFRALTFAISMLCLVMFPTLRWTYIEQFNQRKLEFERNTLLDVINHDLTNINHILLAILEKKPPLTGEDIKLLMKQVERMNSLIEKARFSVRSGPIEPL